MATAGRSCRSFRPARALCGSRCVWERPRVSAAEAHANLVVWERRTPVLVVELSSLIEDARPEGPLSGIGSGLQQDLKPMPDAAAELAKLSQFYYGIIYVATVPSGDALGSALT